MLTRWYHKAIAAGALLLAYGAGWFVEFWTSPMGEPLCVARGSEAVTRVLRDLAADYCVFWAALFLIAGLAAVVPLYGCWYELRTKRVNH